MKNRLQYRTSELFSHGVAQYVAVLIAFVVVTLVGMTAYFVGLFSERSLGTEGIHGNIDRGIWDSLWWSVKHLLDPGQFVENYGAAWPILVISLLLSVAGLALLGTFIGLITSTIQQSFESWKRGNSPVIERGHTLILGWNQNVEGILSYFAEVRHRQRIVILAPYDIQSMHDTIEAGKRNHNRLDVVLRSGLTSDSNELARVSLGEAGCVISVAHERSGSDHPDVGSIKTLMLLNNHDWPRSKPPMVGEVTERQNAEIADIAGGRQIPIVSSGEVISRVIVQCARYPGLSDIFSELFSPRSSNIVVRSFPQFDGALFSTIAYQFSESIPIGVTWSVDTSYGKRTACALNVEPEYDVAADEQLVLISKQAKPLSVASPFDPTPREMKQLRTPGTRLNDIAIIGWNRNIDEVLQELDAHVAYGARITIVAKLLEDEVIETLDKTKLSLKNLQVEYRYGDAVDRHSLEALNPWSYDRLILLADYSRGVTDPDSSTIMTALVLADMQREAGKPLPYAVIELEDAGNRRLLDNMLASDIIVTPELVSRQLAQISQQQVLGAIYQELLSAGGMEIALRSATDYVPRGEHVSFAELIAPAQHYAEVALGVRKAGAGFELNPPKDASWTLYDDDQIVVLAQQVYE